MPRTATPTTFRFAATHGVQLGDPIEPWATFVRDEDLDTADGERRYSFTTEDPEIAGRLRALDDYGVAEILA